eukprot:TRINITY_DN2586_c1_g2_i4.p1 TRINITY_DN2586_c1_g2~~TRINITY_DN2586_c1_g2_i4.p1  ORF type:complete len:143 (-),score=9.08 TRINITY_DN2586_c1_g2_i4:104-532(-)
MSCVEWNTQRVLQRKGSRRWRSSGSLVETIFSAFNKHGHVCDTHHRLLLSDNRLAREGLEDGLLRDLRCRRFLLHALHNTNLGACALSLFSLQLRNSFETGTHRSYACLRRINLDDVPFEALLQSHRDFHTVCFCVRLECKG